MLREKLSNYNIILGSSSPRRQWLFKQLEIPHSIEIKETDERYPPNLSGSEITEYLAELKSNSFVALKESDLLITSDTIVWFENKALGKPENIHDAFKMLKSMSGKKHTVFTSVSIKSNCFQKIFSEKTVVEFDELSDEEITYYLKTYKPFDKAGSYGIQDWIGLIGVKKIDGSYPNVMGLPVHKLYKELRAIAV